MVGDLGVAVVIEDDVDVRNLLDAVLQQAGFEVHSAGTGRDGVDVARQRQANVITLDVGLPDIDGFEVLRRIRQFSDAYVVMLTGRNEELDTITALQGGADDYIVKPFRPRELRARISAMLRRPRVASGEVASSSVAESGSLGPSGSSGSRRGRVLLHNGLALDTETRTVALRGTPLGLTRSEFDLLHELLKGTGAVRTRADLVRVVRGEYYGEDTYISEADERAVEVHIGNLRRKLREDPQDPRWLVTVRGVGYRLAPKRAE
ncbi:putative two-component response regulator [Arthrobacter globiformis NBRC 12137]|uniref:Putative two-component response regulator n=1 Tax=Arthrobacter globiformis (strain ATCC 8010 / DSM 20124 / JCM 1332 / NBRC 12137 / NCIMB 8907 / NRRL B-2979 / 168) TaxID=1077972 RepID=H0QPT6_ARTG1|nr:putative two-component response regulator [Arthrobacter globiformis NBRC 12137]